MNFTRLYNTALRSYALLPYLAGSNRAFMPMQYYALVTMRCNLRCQFCLYESSQSTEHDQAKADAELPASEWVRIVRQLPRRGLMSFSGGEPLMRSDMIEILERSACMRRIHMITNGTLIDREIARRLVKIASKNLFSKGLLLIGVSMHGPEAVHDELTTVGGSWQRTLQGIRYLLEERKRAGNRFPLINLKSVIHEGTYQHLDQLFAFAEELGVDLFNLLLYNPMQVGTLPGQYAEGLQSGWQYGTNIDPVILRENLQQLERRSAKSRLHYRVTPTLIHQDDIIDYYRGEVKLDRYMCLAPWAKVEITAYGDVRPCYDIFAGNLKNQSFHSIWNGEKFRKFRNSLRRNKIYPGCIGCCHIELRH